MTVPGGVNPEIVMATAALCWASSYPWPTPCRSAILWSSDIRKERLRCEVELRGDGPGRPDRPTQDIARGVARRTGRPEADILSLIGAASLTIALIGFLRQVDTVIKAGRTGRQPGTDARPLVLGKGNGER